MLFRTLSFVYLAWSLAQLVLGFVVWAGEPSDPARQLILSLSAVAALLGVLLVVGIWCHAATVLLLIGWTALAAGLVVALVWMYLYEVPVGIQRAPPVRPSPLFLTLGLLAEAAGLAAIWLSRRQSPHGSPPLHAPPAGRPQSHDPRPGAGSRVPFLLWALVACPAIGAASWWISDTAGDAIVLAMFLGLPATLAVVAGLALRQRLEVIVLGSFLAALIGLATMLVIGGLTQGG